MNEGCSGIKKNRILEPEHPLCSSGSDVMPKITIHTFSSKGTSNSFQTRNMQEPVFITTDTIKNDFKVGLSRSRKFLPNYNYPQSCSEKHHHLFVSCLKIKINKF